MALDPVYPDGKTVVDDAALRRALRKLDFIFLPVITLIYVRPSSEGEGDGAELMLVPQLSRCESSSSGGLRRGRRMRYLADATNARATQMWLVDRACRAVRRGRSQAAARGQGHAPPPANMVRSVRHRHQGGPPRRSKVASPPTSDRLTSATRPPTPRHIPPPPASLADTSAQTSATPKPPASWRTWASTPNSTRSH